MKKIPCVLCTQHFVSILACFLLKTHTYQHCTDHFLTPWNIKSHLFDLMESKANLHHISETARDSLKNKTHFYFTYLLSLSIRLKGGGQPDLCTYHLINGKGFRFLLPTRVSLRKRTDGEHTHLIFSASFAIYSCE